MVSPVKFKDEGIYRCFYYNPNGAVSVRRFNVTVLGKLFCAGYAYKVKMASIFYACFSLCYKISDVCCLCCKPKGDPKIATSTHGDRTLVKCSAKGNTPPKISWVIGNDIDLEGKNTFPQYLVIV